MKKLKKIIQEFVINILYKISNQYIWDQLFQLSLRQMNFGNGGYFHQSGELYVANYIKKQLKNEPSIVIFDVGANVGKYATALSNVFDGNTQIYSFEPSKSTFEIFKTNTQGIKNILGNNFGFSDKEFQQLLFTDQEGSGLASVYQRKLDHWGIQMNQSEEIKLTTIDKYCAENQIAHIHFLKLDIEGHELSALKGANETLKHKKIDFIQFEFGGCNIDSRTYFQDFYYLLKDDYTIYRILKDGLLELPVYKETYEIFMTINYLAVKK
ncbi:MAG: FkbM family methyltransferase [Chitinophagales bacterium]|nr:FkbM family methyltransferase [Chitinophagales bacterium]MCZ2393756.1 FkbM family methyltransferase [Chitinophagales bacterium]